MAPKRGLTRPALAIEKAPKKARQGDEVREIVVDATSKTGERVIDAKSKTGERVIDATSKLIKIFSYLDAVLNALERRDIPGVWEKVKDGVEAMFRGTGAAFTLSDFATILTICPTAYKIEWKDVPKDPESQIDLYLCISIASITAANEPSGHSRSLLSETRMDIFQELLYQKLNHLKSTLPAGSVVTIVPDPSVIPQRPVRPATEANAKNSIPEKIRGRDSEAMDVANETVNLHDLAIARGKLKMVEDEQYQKKRRYDIKLERIRSLTSLCDVLRTAARAKGRTIFPLKDCMDRYTLQFNITKSEFSTRLKLINDVVPEFLCVIPTNQRVPVDTLRINLDAPYATVRSKLSDRNGFKSYLDDENQI